MLSPFVGKHLKMIHTFSEGSPYIGKKLVVAHGSVRTGKTAALSILFLDRVLRYSLKYPNVNSIVAGFSYTSVKKNVVMAFIVPELEARGLQYTLTNQSGSSLIIKDGKHRIEIEIHGSGLVNSVGSIQGRTYLIGFVDEGTLAHPTYLKQLELRLSLPESKLLISTNPDNPDHYVKTGIIDAAGVEGGKKVVAYHFILDDNPYLDAGVKEDMKVSFSGMFYDRYIRGLWIALEGRVFGNFGDVNIVDFTTNPGWEYYAGLDFGWNDPCAIILMAYDRLNNTWYIIDEFIQSYTSTASMGKLLTGGIVKVANKERTLTMSELMPNLFRGIYAGHEASARRQESGGLSNRNILQNEYPELKRLIKIGFHYVDISIQAVYNYIGNENHQRLFVHPRCKSVIRDFNNYKYPEKKGEFYGEAPDDSHTNHKYSHSMDAIRYVVDSVTPIIIRQNAKVGW